MLFLSQGREIEDQPDFDKALRGALCCGEKLELHNLPFLSFIEKYGGARFYDEILKINAAFRPDLVFFQFFHSGNSGDPRPCVRALQGDRNHPLVFGSLGDPFDTGLLKMLGRPMPNELLQLASVADAMFTTAMGRTADELVRHGAQNVVFLPHAFNQSHFSLAGVDERAEKKYDVVMVGSRAGVVVPHILTGINRGFARVKTVTSLSNAFGEKFALYGKGWKNSSYKGIVPYDQQLEAMKEGRTSVDVPAQINDRYYASDRPFFIAGSGTPLVMKWVAGFDRILRPNEHAYYAKSIAELPDVCARVLKLPEEVLDVRRRSTLKLIAKRHLISNRMDTLLSVYEAIRAVRDRRMSSAAALRTLRLWHFLPEIDLETEYQFAIRNWVG